MSERARVCGAVKFACLCYSWSNMARWTLLFSAYRSQNNLTGMVSEKALLCFWLGITTEFLELLPFFLVLVFSSNFFCSLPAGVMAWGRFVGFKWPKLKHIICGWRPWTRAGQLDNWQVSLQVKGGWMFSKEAALWTAWQRQYWAQCRPRELTLQLKTLKKLENVPCANVAHRYSAT